MLTWELLGAAVGAGLASGREIAAFFGRQGAWGYAGIAMAVLTLGMLAGARLPQGWQGRWPARLWRLSRGLLLTAAGGAMLAGAGAVAVEATGVAWGYLPALAGTLALAGRLAGRESRGLARVSRLLLLAMGALLLRAAQLPPSEGARCPGDPAQALLLGALLAAGLTVLLRSGGTAGAEAPFVALAARGGRWGALLAGLCLYLAALSTLTACLRGLGRGRGMAAVAAAAALGFSGVVDVLYPLLGGLCWLLLTAMRAANLLNSCRNTFHSRRGVL